MVARKLRPSSWMKRTRGSPERSPLVAANSGSVRTTSSFRSTTSIWRMLSWLAIAEPVFPTPRQMSSAFSGCEWKSNGKCAISRM